MRAHAIVAALLAGISTPTLCATVSERGPLTLERRIAHQRAIEEIYWRHRTWPAENPGAKPSLDQVMPTGAIADEVASYLQASNALASRWGRGLGTRELQAELERMVRDTRRPTMLMELFAALEDDPFLIAECLVRPRLAARRLRAVYAAVEGPPVPRGRSFEDWWRAMRGAFPTDLDAPAYRYVLPRRDAAVDLPAPDSWSPTFVDIPTGRVDHTAVWTGSEMIIWGGSPNQPDLFTSGYTNTGGRYDPSTDTWMPGGTSLIGAPSPRFGHTAVWTGTEMIVWGGADGGSIASGGRYNPSTDTWTTTSPTGAPAGRCWHTAVWTGSEMIVWGGADGGTALATGGRYSPATDSWAPGGTSMSPAPRATYLHTAIWTGIEMITWGGLASGPGAALNRYDPTLDQWGAVSSQGAPLVGVGHSAIWTGAEMIVWGGIYASSVGGRYDPVLDIWRPTTPAGAPSPRDHHTAIWTGDRMLVWGGRDGTPIASGAAYDPVANAWSPMSTVSQPGQRSWHTAIWTGQEMIVWGGQGGNGFSDLGGRYDPAVDRWAAGGTGINTVPSGRWHHTAIWTGSEVIVWGGESADATNEGGRYDPATDSWSPTPLTGAPSPTTYHSAVWTGSEMIVWSGYYPTLDGGRYSPTSNSWAPGGMSTLGAPPPRNSFSACWTGREMAVWGGYGNGVVLCDGGRYDPASDSWSTMSSANAPPGAAQAGAAWTGRELIVWGGDGLVSALASGGRYNPSADSWAPTATSGAPAERTGHASAWTGRAFVVWGGYNNVTGILGTGGRYDPATDSWAAGGTTLVGAPTARVSPSTVWTGREMIVWGGLESPDIGTGGRYDPAADSWAFGGTSQAGAPVARYGHTAIWTGDAMIVWGGLETFGRAFTNSGGIYWLPSSVDHVVGEGLGQSNGNGVRVYTGTGVPAPVSFVAYATGRWGVNVASGRLDGGPIGSILTGPGPGYVFGPQVRGFRRDGTAISKVDFFAYGTLRFGANVAAADVDGDGYDEILSGAGSGAVFGPHVRGWNFDAGGLAPIPRVSFYAYGTLRFGVNVAGGDLDGGAADEIVTGPGPGLVFGPQVRGFTYDGSRVAALGACNFFAFPYAGFGVNAAAGDVDMDGNEEIVATPGPGSTHPARFLGFDYDGTSVHPLSGFDATPFTTSYGGRAGAGDLDGDGAADLQAGAGPDPAATTTVETFSYAAGSLATLPGSFTPFSGAFGVNVASGSLGY